MCKSCGNHGYISAIDRLEYLLDKNSHYQGSFLESNINALSLKIDNVEISTQLPGYFNGYNIWRFVNIFGSSSPTTAPQTKKKPIQ